MSLNLSRSHSSELTLQSKIIKGKNYGITYWNGHDWNSFYPEKKLDFLEEHPLNNNAIDTVGGLRIVYIGYADEDGPEWNGKQLSPEFIAFKLEGDFIEGKTYSFHFIYLTNGWDYSQKITGFAPLVFTNTSPTLKGAHLSGRLPEAGVDWTKGSVSFVATAEQVKHRWLILHPGYGGPAGMILSPCAFPFILRSDSINENDSLNSLNFTLEKDKLLKTGKIILQNISFENNTYLLHPTSYPELDSLVDFLNKNPSVNINVLGYTDDIGKEDENQKLSEYRAKAVYEYLINKQISSDRISYFGMGESDPLFPNTNDENRKKNRRVEIQIVN